jgi:hypothetical protein
MPEFSAVATPRFAASVSKIRPVDLQLVDAASAPLMQTAALQRRPAIPPRDRRPEVGYSLKVEEIGYHMFYGGHGAYLYQPIPKCACTTIKTLLLRLEGLPVDDNHWRRHQKELNGFPGTSHLPILDQLDIFEGRTSTFKFTFVRNPYIRLASIYYDKIRMNPSPYFVRQIRKSAAKQGMLISDEITFAEFVSVVSRQSLAEMDCHCRPQFYEGRFGMLKYDFVGRMEWMARDLTYVLERIGAPEAIIARINEKHNEAGSSIAAWDSVPDDVRQLFLSAFGIDFDVLEYSREFHRPAELCCA